MAGFDNDIVYAKNGDFTQADNQNVSEANGLVTDSQLWIGSTATNAGGTHINVGTITSPDSSITFGYSTPNITAVVNSAVIQDLHISPYIVSASGAAVGASYTTIQAALDAADLAGGGMIWVQPGTYTEDLTLYDNTQVIGAVGFSDFGGGVVIVGEHTPPSSGSFVFRNVQLQGDTGVFVGNAAGSATLVIGDSSIVVDNGYCFNLPNWTGAFQVWDTYSGDGTNDGFINNTGGAFVYGYEAGVGAGTNLSMTTSSIVQMEGCQITCKCNFATNSSFVFDECQFAETVTVADSGQGRFRHCVLSSSAGASITTTSASGINIDECVISSAGGNAIDGTGSVALGGVTFNSNYGIASTVGLTSRPVYAQTPPYVAQGSSATVRLNFGNFVNDTITLTTPSQATTGDSLEFVVKNGVLTIDIANGLVAHVGSAATSAGGTITSTAVGDSLTLKYDTVDDTWWATSVIGNWILA